MSVLLEHLEERGVILGRGELVRPLPAGEAKDEPARIGGEGELGKEAGGRDHRPEQVVLELAEPIEGDRLPACPLGEEVGLVGEAPRPEPGLGLREGDLLPDDGDVRPDEGAHVRFDPLQFIRGEERALDHPAVVPPERCGVVDDQARLREQGVDRAREEEAQRAGVDADSLRVGEEHRLD